jgi:hypothetical protein
MPSKASKTLYNGFTVYRVCYPMPIHCKASVESLINVSDKTRYR